MSASEPATDYKQLYRRLESTLERIERVEDNTEMLENVLEILVGQFHEELGFEMGRLYKRDWDDFYLCYAAGGTPEAPIGYRIPRDYPPHRRTLKEGIVIMRKGDPGFDSEIERLIGVDATFAAIAIGRGNTHVIAFSVGGDAREDAVLYSLSAVRHVVNLKLEQSRMASTFEEAKIIQQSLLPASPPEFEGYEIFGLSRAAEVVAGDLFDYLTLSDQLLGVAIADASGHGLPAALLARDVITALRVGIDENLKVISVIERLNRVIHRAVLSSRFISLFYGEFERNGTLVYCNAGHNPPLLCRKNNTIELTEGGMILGPDPNALYERGYVRLNSEDFLLLYTDGLVERQNARREEFGMSRPRRAVRQLRGKSAEEVVTSILEASDRHAKGAALEDDTTVVAVKRC